MILVPAYTNFLLQNTLFHKMGNKFSPKCVSLSKISFSFSCLHSTEVVEIHLHTYMAAAAKGKRKYIFKYTLQLLTLSNITEAKTSYQLLFSLQLIHNFLI